MYSFFKPLKTKLYFYALILFVPFVLKAQVFTQQIDVGEASAILSISGNRFLTVDDEKGIFLINDRFESSLLMDSKEFEYLNDLEGISISTDRKFLYCLSEDQGRITRIPIKIEIDSVELGIPDYIGSLPVLGEDSNKGWEGICIISSRQGDMLLGIHQKKPKLMALFELPSLRMIGSRELSDELKNKVKNLSDLTVDQRTGNVLLLSGKSQKVLETKVDISKGLGSFSFVREIDIPPAPEGRPEGICFDAKDRLIAVTDGAGKQGYLIFLAE